MRLFVKFALLALLCAINCQNKRDCKSGTSCKECMLDIQCVWCTKPKNNASNLLAGTCQNRNEVEPDWCPYDNLYDVATNLELINDDELESGRGNPVVQLKPQRVRLLLRKGDESQVHFQYAQATDYPIDLYYVMDSSNTMRVHKNKLSELGDKLVEVMRNITTNFRLGFGSFVDKAEMPFTSTHPSRIDNPCSQSSPCIKCHSFINHLSLTQNYSQFSTEVINAKDSGNIDAPEGGLDALMQAMVCKEEIGWRQDARHLIVYSTDSLFHVAGDGRLSGAVEPNDGKCHLQDNDYTQAALVYDYPSISLLNHVAKENNMNVIFAIAEQDGEEVLPAYEELHKHIEHSGVGELTQGSANVIELILESYKKIVSSIQITDNSTSTVDIVYQANCSLPTENGCDGIHAGEIVNFTATIKAIECLEGSYEQLIQIKPEGGNDVLLVELEIMCECDCAKSGHEDYVSSAPECSNQGDLACGVCACGSGYFGKNCECDSSKLFDKDQETCLKLNDTLPCSGQGDCVCGQCVCHEKVKGKPFTGRYCECDDYSCKRHNSMLCSGENNGRCECGSCKCLSGWTGDACECPTSNRMCISPRGDGKVCSDHGDCVCGECLCTKDEYSYSGKYCEECISCSGERCEELRPCVECQAFQTGIYSQSECIEKCDFMTEMVDKIEEQINNEQDDVKICRILDHNGCTIVYQYSYNETNQLIVKALKDRSCPEAANINAIVIIVIASIVIGGIILLAIWKAFTEVHDRREYAKFENERDNMKWNAEMNPLFRNPNTMVLNPRYGSNFD